MEHIDHLGQQRDAGNDRDGFASELGRLALAVEMFIERIDALRHGFWETQQARDVRATLAARGDQALCDLGSVAQDRHDAAKAFRQPGLQPGVLEHEAEHLRQAVAHGLEIALEIQIVGEIELADASRVAAAAEVLQQQCVRQLPQLLLGETDGAADVHANPATTHAMSRRLALGDVERIAQRPDQFGEFHGARQQSFRWHGERLHFNSWMQ